MALGPNVYPLGHPKAEAAATSSVSASDSGISTATEAASEAEAGERGEGAEGMAAPSAADVSADPAPSEPSSAVDIETSEPSVVIVPSAEVTEASAAPVVEEAAPALSGAALKMQIATGAAASVAQAGENGEQVSTPVGGDSASQEPAEPSQQ